jgi:putative SOS response-associated peptidase YedK
MSVSSQWFDQYGTAVVGCHEDTPRAQERDPIHSSLTEVALRCALSSPGLARGQQPPPTTRMCSNYRPVTATDRLLSFFGVERARHDPPPADVFPGGLAPIIVLAPDDGSTPRRLMALEDAIFRMVPDFIARVEWARRTYNARSETVSSKRTFSRAWAQGRRCIVPAERIYEPRYDDSGKSTRWAIQQAGAVPMGIAGIYDEARHPDGRRMLTMAMLTVNADAHPFMRQFHKPGEEKRMVAILDPKDYAAWLSCPVAEAAGFLKPWEGPLEGMAAPLASRGARPQAAPAGAPATPAPADESSAAASQSPSRPGSTAAPPESTPRPRGRSTPPTG